MGQPLRLLELEVSKDDRAPKALYSYGLLEPQRREVQVRFVDGRPVSHVTTAFLDWRSRAGRRSRRASRRRDLG